MRLGTIHTLYLADRGHDDYDDDEHAAAAAALSGAATLPSQQAPGGRAERVTGLHKPIPNTQLIRPPRAVRELAAD
jgi:hypothetical protein